MDEKTEQLRAIFMEVAEDETITEHQEDSRGSLATADEVPVEERLRSVIERMRERYEFHTSLPDDDLVAVVTAFYDGENDTEIAREIGDESLSKTVSRARIDLHLVTDRDTDAPLDLDELRRALDDDRSLADVAGEFDVSESTVRRYRRIARVQEERRIVGDRFREEFDRILSDRELGERLAVELRETGLEDATEGMETDVSF